MPTLRRMLATLIVNRTAWDGEPTEAQLSAIQTWIARGDVAASVEFTSTEKSAREITREGLARGIELFIVVGGDGTVGEVARELIGKRRPWRFCLSARSTTSPVPSVFCRT